MPHKHPVAEPSSIHQQGNMGLLRVGGYLAKIGISKVYYTYGETGYQEPTSRQRFAPVQNIGIDHRSFVILNNK
jgi:hypothetical protein